HRAFRPAFSRARRWFFQKISDGIMRPQQPLDPLTKCCVTIAGTLQKCCTLRGSQLQCLGKHAYLRSGVIVHDEWPLFHSPTLKGETNTCRSDIKVKSAWLYSNGQNN